MSEDEAVFRKTLEEVSKFMKLYVLVGHEAKPVADMGFIEWTEHLGKNRRVAQTVIGPSEVSTVFLGMDHNLRGDGPPLLFETMVFGGAHDRHTQRCSTWDEAVKMHDNVCAMVQRANGGDRDPHR